MVLSEAVQVRALLLLCSRAVSLLPAGARRPREVARYWADDG